MRKHVDTLNIVMAVIAGITLIAAVINPNAVGARITRIGEYYSAIPAFLIGALVVLLNILQAIKEIRTQRNLSVTTEDGVSTLSIEALERQLLASVENLEDVCDLEISLNARGEGLPVLCHVSFKLKKQEDVLARTDEIKKMIREAFLRIIPKSVGIEIHANVRDIVLQTTPKVKTKAAPAEKGSKSNEFSGPVYPTDMESESL